MALSRLDLSNAIMKFTENIQWRVVETHARNNIAYCRL